MAKSQLREYRVQSGSDKSTYYEVRLAPGKNGIREASCTCREAQAEGSICEHIEKARTCYVYGF